MEQRCPKDLVFIVQSAISYPTNFAKSLRSTEIQNILEL